MPASHLSTYGDLVDFLVGQSRGGGSDVEFRDVKMAAFHAYQELSQLKDWQFYRKRHRVLLEAAYSTGTVAFDYSGGTHERQLTLSSGTWPSWAASGRVVINEISYDVERRISDTVVTLDATFNPGADVSSTSYTLIKTHYDLPWDFQGMWDPTDEKSYTGLYVPPESWHVHDRVYPSTSSMWYYTIMPSVDSYASWQLLIHGYVTTDETFDFIYQGRARPIRYTGYETKARGTFSASAAGVTVTGSGTSFDSTMIGSVIRVSASTTAPTGLFDLNPWAEQKTIVAVASATSLTVDTAFDNAYTSKAFVISDPLDTDENLNNALVELATARLNRIRGAESWPQDRAYAEKICRMAMENEVRPKHVRWSTGQAGLPAMSNAFDYATVSNSSGP